MTEKNISLGELIRRRRKQLGMTQRDLGEKIHMSHSTLSRLETTPGAFADTKTLVALSQALDLDLTGMLAKNHYIPDGESLSTIARARGKMPQSERDRMMQLLRTEFVDYFDEDDSSELEGQF